MLSAVRVMVRSTAAVTRNLMVYTVSSEGQAPSGIWTRNVRVMRSLQSRSNHCDTRATAFGHTQHFYNYMCMMASMGTAFRKILQDKVKCHSRWLQNVATAQSITMRQRHFLSNLHFYLTMKSVTQSAELVDQIKSPMYGHVEDLQGNLDCGMERKYAIVGLVTHVLIDRKRFTSRSRIVHLYGDVISCKI
jgi:hypothetical protein